MEESSKTVLSMEKARKCMQMVTNTKEIISTVFAKVVALLNGQMVVFTMVILNKVIVMGMVSGSQIKQQIKYTKVITCWIKSMDMANTIGEMDMFLKVITWKIKEMAMESCILKKKSCIKGNGSMVRNLKSLL